MVVARLDLVEFQLLLPTDGKMIFNDVNVKTVDNLIAGVEAITGVIMTHVILENIRTFGYKYMK